jgi:hypothetical protein
VVPVFDRLYQNDRTGCSWLPKLLTLPAAEYRLSLPPNCTFAIKDHCWGANEKKLNPPVALLSWLIRHPRKPISGTLSADSAKEEKRRQWLDGSRDRLLEGLILLRTNPNGYDWHIFEGETQPDVFIETDDLIVVIEGKRTEAKPTTTTKWMQGRNQMLRHLDCAWEIRGRKILVGFFIVEGEGVSIDIPEQWRAFSTDTISPTTIASSLPHRGPAEQQGIASCFLGATTWQLVCKEFGIDWASLPDELEQ